MHRGDFTRLEFKRFDVVAVRNLSLCKRQEITTGQLLIHSARIRHVQIEAVERWIGHLQ